MGKEGSTCPNLIEKTRTHTKKDNRVILCLLSKHCESASFAAAAVSTGCAKAWDKLVLTTKRDDDDDCACSRRRGES